MECTVRDIPIYYEDIDTGIPILMLHGSHPDHREMLLKMEPLFVDRSGWRRIYPDLPGRGKTPGADWISNQDDILAILLEFIDTIAPGEQFAVAGYSYGGFMARGIIYSRKEQVNGVLLAAPAVRNKEAASNLPPHQILVHDPEFVAALGQHEQMVLRVAVVQSLEVLEAIRAGVLSGVAVADHDFIKRTASNYEFSFDADRLPEPCLAPTLIVTGRQDSMCGYQEAWSLLDDYPRATFAVLDRAGHAMSSEQQGLFYALVSEWLDRVEEYSSRK